MRALCGAVTDQVHDELARFPAAKRVKWVQEEPQNMGAWTFAEVCDRDSRTRTGHWVTELTEGASPWPRRFPSKQPRLRSVLNGRLPLEYVGRPAAVCATGIAAEHKKELETFMAAAF